MLTRPLNLPIDQLQWEASVRGVWLQAVMMEGMGVDEKIGPKIRAMMSLEIGTSVVEPADWAVTSHARRLKFSKLMQSLLTEWD
jgi:hypothetical protein